MSTLKNCVKILPGTSSTGPASSDACTSPSPSSALSIMMLSPWSAGPNSMASTYFAHTTQ